METILGKLHWNDTYPIVVQHHSAVIAQTSSIHDGVHILIGSDEVEEMLSRM